MKRPSFQFYPSDWLRDTALRSCSTGARGLWIDMICYMHEGNPYGYLKVKDKVILPANLARMCGLTTEEVEGWLIELKSSGVCEADDDGAIYSRRMIRDENLRVARSAGGKLGGNPRLKVNLLVNHEDNGKVENEVNQKPTPSSSSSSSSSSIVKTLLTQPPVAVLSGIDRDGFDTFWATWPQSQRKVGKVSVQAKWKKLKLSSIAKQIIEHVKLMKASKQWQDGYEPAPLTYINQQRWEDGEQQSADDQQFAGVM